MKAVLAEQPNPAPQTPTAPARFLIVTVALVGRIARLIPNARAGHLIAAPAHASNAPLTHNVPAIPHIARVTRVPTCFIRQVVMVGVEVPLLWRP